MVDQLKRASPDTEFFPKKHFYAADKVIALGGESMVLSRPIQSIWTARNIIMAQF